MKKALPFILIPILTYVLLRMIYINLVLDFLARFEVEFIALQPLEMFLLNFISPLFIATLVTITLGLMVKNYGSWQQALIRFFPYFIISFALNFLYLRFILNLNISPNLTNQARLSFSLLYSTTMYVVVPIFLIHVMKFFSLKEQIPRLRNKRFDHLDYRLKRFLGNMIDVVICLILTFVLDFIPLTRAFSFLLLYFLYKFILESSLETTIGKAVVGFFLISTKDKPFDSSRIFVRNLSRLIPFYSLPILFQKPGIHDMISQTEVVGGLVEEELIEELGKG